MARLRIVFMGTPELAAASLQALLREHTFDVVAVVTQPDKPRGRELKLQPSPVKQIAVHADLPVLQPAKARDGNFVAALNRLQPDLIAVAAYGHILPESILDLPRFGCLNVHTSLLPKYRGAAPIQWAILNDETETGVTIMKMDAGLDTGDIVAQEKTAVRVEDNSQTLHDRLARMGAELLVRTIPEFVAGRIQPHPQPADGVSHAPKIKKDDGRIDWSQPARAIWNKVRGFTPWPGAFTHLFGVPPSAPKRFGAEGGAPNRPHLLKLWHTNVISQTGAPGEIIRADKDGIVIACGKDSLQITALQREGGRQMSAREFLAGHPLKPGTKLG